MKQPRNVNYFGVEMPRRSCELVQQMIPVLISWAQEGRSPQYYSTLSRAIGHKTSEIAYQLDIIGKIFKELRSEYKEKNIPTLNALIISKGNNRPSDGLGTVIEGFDKLSETEKRKKAKKLNEEAYAYQNWDWVLEVLGLLPYNGESKEIIQKTSSEIRNEVLYQPKHRKINNNILDSHTPSLAEVNEYIQKWNALEDYVNQENALDKLFLDLCKDNRSIENILIKCSALNDFYSTNIFKIHNVAQHYLRYDIDGRLAAGDLTLVHDLAHIEINGKPFYLYSFASKYCSHHRPDVFPIYDSYVHKLLKYFRDRDNFYNFTEKDLKEYVPYTDIILNFQTYYGLKSFTIKEIDKYLWQLGKEAFNKYDK